MTGKNASPYWIRKPLRGVLFFFVLVVIDQAALGQDLDSLFHRLNSAKADTTKVMLLNKISGAYLFRDVDSAKYYAELSIAAARKINYTLGEASAHAYLAQYYKIVSQMEKAKQENDCAFLLYKEIDNYVGLGASWHFYGMYYASKGQQDSAASSYLNALEYYERAGERKGQGVVLNSLAILYSNIGLYEESMSYFLQSLEIKKQINDERGASVICLNIGQLMYTQDRFDEAFHYFNMGLKMQEKLKDTYIILQGRLNLGNLYMHYEKFDSALILYEQNEEVYRAMNDSINLGLTLAQIAEVHYHRGNAVKALECLKTAAAITFQLPDNYVLQRYVHMLYSTIYETTGDYDLALDHFKQVHQLDSLYRIEESNRTVLELKENYETEKIEEENALLRERDKVSGLELAQRESAISARNYYVATLCLVILLILTGGFFLWRQAKLKQQKFAVELEQKALRAQMNPHFIFNCLNSIQRMYIEGESEKANEYTADFAQLMRKILDNSDKSKIPLAEELLTLKLYLELERLRCGEQIAYSIAVGESIDTAKIMVPPLVFQPFVENAIWHGILRKNEPGTIAIDLSLSDKQIRCVVKDDGAGFDREKPSGRSSMGIQITEQRIGSRVQIESTAGKGTEVIFYLPV